MAELPIDAKDPRKSGIRRFLDALGIPRNERKEPMFHRSEMLGRTGRGYVRQVLVDDDGALLLSPESSIKLSHGDVEILEGIHTLLTDVKIRLDSMIDEHLD